MKDQVPENTDLTGGNNHLTYETPTGRTRWRVRSTIGRSEIALLPPPHQRRLFGPYQISAMTRLRSSRSGCIHQ